MLSWERETATVFDTHRTSVLTFVGSESENPRAPTVVHDEGFIPQILYTDRITESRDDGDLVRYRTKSIALRLDVPNHSALASFLFPNRSAGTRGVTSVKGLFTIYADRMTRTPQTSCTRYFLRVIVISVTTVPKSSRSYSACWLRLEDRPVTSSSYEGREPEPSVSDSGREGADVPSIFTGINFHIRLVLVGLISQNCA